MKKGKTFEDMLVSEITELGRTHGLNTVFTTFLELTATSLAIQMDLVNQEERKARCEELESSLDKKELNSYGRMTMYIVLAIAEHKEDPKDILGEVYTRLNLANEWNGQFFTPDTICRLMVEMLQLTADIPDEKNNYIKINEPTCGSGAMMIAAAWAMQKEGVEYQKHTFFVAQDIDIRCVWMAYIQCCLYRIPAVVVHGNTLTMEMWSYWYTYDGMELLATEQCVNEIESIQSTEMETEQQKELA